MNIPEVTFKTRIGDNQTLGGGCSIGGQWQDINTNEIFNNKKIVLFSLPGAYTPTCSSQQLPGYEEKYEELKKFGIIKNKAMETRNIANKYLRKKRNLKNLEYLLLIVL